MFEDKVLLTLSETAVYLGLGKTKTRELFKQYDQSFVAEVGNRKYAHKDKLDAWLLGQVKMSSYK